ncbi:tetratricopeptide repeat protein [Alkalibacillus aidingensis]|uniref:tetratricopeptide repeat protein n=1 Tax=Alkalibacillus aidingensis TaxID=2747607 RepID=UPI0016600C00|nr:tetratricopeptide repeat protein [Alkalibacillus aidingensis]
MPTRSEQTTNPTENIATFRNDGDFYFSCGIKAFKRKNFKKAEKWLKKAIDHAPTNALYLCQLSVLYTELHQYHLANDLLQKVLETHDDDYVDCYYLLANNHAHLGLFYEAKRYANLYLEKDTDGDFKEEVEDLIKVINQVMFEEIEDEDVEIDDEDEFIIYQETAFFHLEHEEWGEALQVLEDLMTIYPEYFPAKHEYAYALFQLGDREEALTLEEGWFEQDPQSLHSRINLVYFYHQLGLGTKRDYLYSCLENTYPTYDEKKMKLAILMAQIGQCQSAVERFERIPKGKAANYMSYYLWYGYALKQTGQHERAEQLWHKAKQQHPVIEQLIKAHQWD